MEKTKKLYAPDELICAEAIHPGEMLKDELQARGLSQRKFAGIIGMPYTAFNEIVQADYNMQTARHDSRLSLILEQIRKAVAVL